MSSIAVKAAMKPALPANRAPSANDRTRSRTKRVRAGCATGFSESIAGRRGSIACDPYHHNHVTTRAIVAYRKLTRARAAGHRASERTGYEADMAVRSRNTIVSDVARNRMAANH